MSYNGGAEQGGQSANRVGNRGARSGAMTDQTSDSFTIRLATLHDLPAIRGVLLSVRSEFDVVDDTDASDTDLDDLERNYFGRGGVFEVVEDCRSSQIVG